jgi:hypothetical protein
MEEAIQMRPIGYVRSPHKEAKGTPIQGVFAGDVEATVELDQQYVDGLKDLEGFSHAILIYYFHKSDSERLIGKPYLKTGSMGSLPSAAHIVRITLASPWCGSRALSRTGCGSPRLTSLTVLRS